MSDRILVAYDGSPPARTALEFAFDEFPDADVTALYVVEIPEGYLGVIDGPDISVPLTGKAREHADSVLEPARALAADCDRNLETEVDSGKPAHRIVERALEDDCETIVLGSHGRQAISRVVLGSVAERVVRRSPIPVAVVPSTSH
ncbi:universal stress protein [Natrarchaeobaculum sulfurireducens]|uniref:Nucleotide-binding protein, UspA family n=1 Tax=Natrarchaeobaculum sulfurireducens TaxID=2044521 RepID=A0A346PD27_9EURY|nr:universal stress protein [Natrarchaeobaculum sulfurireducens]AXR77422.1 Nucleotide-binding protein, UspA family [Natrarchaeobaculum sulfurireducens]